MSDPDIGDVPPKDFYEIGREYYLLDHTGAELPIMTMVTGHVMLVVDPRNGRRVWAQPTCTVGVFGDDSYTIFAMKGQLTPVERPSGEASIFKEFGK